MKQRVKIIGIARHRLSTDGDGVTTLVAFHGCPLRCRYCLNPQSLDNGDRFREYSPEELYAETRLTSYISSPQTAVLHSEVASRAYVLISSVSSASCAVRPGNSI